MSKPATPPAEAPRPRPRLRLPRPALPTEALLLGVALYLTAVANQPFYARLLDLGVAEAPGGAWRLAALALAVTALHLLLLGLLAVGRATRPVLALALLASASAAYFARHYGAVFDAGMLRNVLGTDPHEAGELMTAGALGWIALAGGLPALAVLWLRRRPRPWRRALAARAALLLGALLAAAGGLAAAYGAVAVPLREHRELRYLVTPGNLVAAVVRVATDALRAPRTQPPPLDPAATLAPRPADARPRLLVIVLGETVRAANWGLAGYARQTTPRLAAIDDLVAFNDVEACGTSTEVSVPCIFSPLGRGEGGDGDAPRRSRSLLHLLHEVGVGVLWRSNQATCKGVCTGLPREDFLGGDDPDWCGPDGCLDRVLLAGLRERIAAAPGDLVVVLHQQGNHGPGYHLRHAPGDAPFQPECRSLDLARCTPAEVVNAYDNALRETDHLVADAIALLGEVDTHDAVLLYVSDHGESLGEGGVYLHGLPYALAPSTQTRVPMLFWASEGFRAARGLDLGCLRTRAAGPASHDDVFHSVLGVFDLRSRLRDPARDLVQACAAAPATAQPAGATSSPASQSASGIGRANR